MTQAKEKYGLDMLAIALRSGDYGWNPKKDDVKKHWLVNVEECRHVLDLMTFASLWRETGHSEWEFLLSAWFLYAVIKRDESGAEYADISPLFEVDLLSRNKGTFPREKVRAHIMPSFTKVYEDDTDVHYKLNV